MSQLRVDEITNEAGDGPPEIPYDNTTSGLTATDVQAAIDELAGSSVIYAYKHVTKTDTQFESSVSPGLPGFEIDDLSITIAVDDEDDEVLIDAMVSGQHAARVSAYAIAVDGVIVDSLTGDSAGNRTSVTSGAARSDSTVTIRGLNATPISVVYKPEDTDPHTYTIRFVSLRNSTLQDCAINRTVNDENEGRQPRSISTMRIMLGRPIDE